MLIRFTVANYRSFLEPVELDMRATALKAHRATHIARLTVASKVYEVLKSAVIYGPNASGKSNFVQALGVMRHLVLKSATAYQIGDPLPIRPFKLDPTTATQPSFFEVVFLHADRRYRYGFRATREIIHEEWLYHARQRESLLFHREESDFYLSSTMRRAHALRTHTRPNALFLSVLAQFHHPVGEVLFQWFRDKLNILQGSHIEPYLHYTITRLQEEPVFRNRVLRLLRLADMGIDDLRVVAVPFRQLLADLPNAVHATLQEILPQAQDENVLRVETSHQGIPFSLDEESDGTQKFLALLGPWLEALTQGRVLVVDELESHLHPFLTRQLVALFHSRVNRRQAQLLFTTHALSLLDEELFRRDQIWFMEKDARGATRLYSLADLRERPDVALAKRYSEGRYGAIPHVGAMVPLLEEALDGPQT